MYARALGLKSSRVATSDRVDAALRSVSCDMPMSRVPTATLTRANSARASHHTARVPANPSDIVVTCHDYAAKDLAVGNQKGSIFRNQRAPDVPPARHNGRSTAVAPTFVCAWAHGSRTSASF